MTETPIVPFPASPYCQVRARVASIWADGPDDGTHPDWRPATGEKVTLTPSIGSQLLTYDVGGTDPIIVTVERVECVVDEDGWLAKSDGRPVYIAPTDDPLLSATGWTWTATIKGKAIAFSAPAGGVVDLALFVATPAVNATEYVSVVQIVADYITANPPDVEQAVADYLTANPPAPTPDATADTKGVLQLAGDLGGTSDAPTVPGLADKADADHTHVLADVTDYSPPDLSGYATTTALASGLSGKADSGHGHTAGDVSGLSTVATSGDYADLTGKPTIPDSPDDIGAAPATHDHTAADIDSGAAADGHVLTADGAGGAAWEAPSGGGAPLSQSSKYGSTALIYRSGTFKPTSSSRLPSHYNAEEIHATSLGVSSRSGDGTSEHMLVIYTSPAPNTFELLFHSPAFTVSGETMHSFSCDLVIPRGVLFIQLLVLSGEGGTFNAGVRNMQYEPVRDINGSGAAELGFSSSMSSGWTPPQTVTITSANHWAASQLPQVLVGGVFV